MTTSATRQPPLRITVKDETDELVARFVMSDDAKVYAEAMTANPHDPRVLYIESKTEGLLYVVRDGIAANRY